MATFGEIVYSVLDLLKERSDDAYYTEEHIMFLASKMRALLLERKYKNTRNSSFSPMSEENKQQICMQVSPASLLESGCGGNWLKSSSVIPDLLTTTGGITCTGHDLLQSNVVFIARERMPYVGYNKWLKNIIYAAKSIDGHLYLKGSNPQFMLLEQVGLTGVFADPEAAAKMSHEACMTGVCDIMSQPFPLEAALVPSCIELIVQELTGARYAPEDKDNNARDDLGGMGINQKLTSAPAENTTYNRREPQEEEQ